MDNPKLQEPRPYRIRLPIQLRDEVGLGELIKRATSQLGLRPCSGCERRAATLNRVLRISGNWK